MTLRGRLIVAEPMLADPNFHRTVVFIIDHSEEGALGVVLNRAGDVPVGDVVPTWAPYVTDPATLFVGGPVSREAAICLARCPRGTESSLWSPLSALGGDDPLPRAGRPGRGDGREIGVLDLHGDPTDAPSGIDAIRIFGGYAGWTAGQLEAELAMDGWLVLDANDEDPFTPAPENLWRRVLARQRGAVRRFAAYPADPSLN